MKNIKTAIPIFYQCTGWLWFVTAFLFVHAHAQAAPQILAVDYLYLSSSAEQVSFKLNGPYMPKDFTLKGEKPRIVFDFIDTGLATGVQSIIPIDGPLIEKIRIGRHKGTTPKTRVVFDLATNDEFEIKKEFDDQQSALVITVSYPMEPEVASMAQDISKEPGPPAAEIEPEKTPEIATEKDAVAEIEPQEKVESVPAAIATTDQATTQPEVPVEKAGKILESISFDIKPDKGELVLFKLNGFHPPIVYGVEQGMPRVVCDFKNTEILKNVTTIKDLSAKHVRSIRVGKHTNPNKIRVVIDLQAQKNYDIEQVFFKEDNLFVIIINDVLPAQ